MTTRLALIIGNSLFRDETLTQLQKPDADVGALADLLLDPEVGGFDDAKLLVNMSSAAVRRGISEFFAGKQRDDLLLLYFSGHGILDDQGRLYLAVKDTDRKLLSATAIPTAFVADEMNNSHSKRQVLVLDCCHSGAFSRGAKGVTGANVGTAVTFEGTGYGRVVLTASEATQYAWEGDQIIGKAENSLFTHFLIQGLQSGQADLNADGRITVDELYDYVYEEVTKQSHLQTPGKWSYKEQGQIIIAQNPLHPPVPEEVVSTALPEIKTSITQARPTVEPGEKEKLTAVLFNEGGAGENLQVSIGGVPPEWVSPTTLTTSLMPGERKEIDFTFHPPKTPQSRAGEYDVTLKVTDQETKTAYTSTNVKLDVLSFSRFSSEMFPRKIMPGTYSTVSVENLGNFNDTFQVTVTADIGESSHRPAQSQLSVPAGGKDSIEFYAPQPQRYLFGRDKIFPLIATVRSSSGETQTVNGELIGKATIPLWLISVIVLLCITIVSGSIIISQLGKGGNGGVGQVLPPATQITGHATSPIETIVITPETLPTSTGIFVEPFPAPEGTQPSGLAWDGNYLWMSSYMLKPGIYKLDPINGSVISVCTPPTASRGGYGGLAFDGKYLLQHGYDHGIYKLSTSDCSVISSIPSPENNISDLAWDGQYIWTCGYPSQKIYKIDPGSGEVVTEFDVPPGIGQAQTAGLTYAGSSLWLSGNDNEILYEINPLDGQVISSKSISISRPGSLTWDGNRFWIASFDEAMIYPVDHP
jgi:hypothetical protein